MESDVSIDENELNKYISSLFSKKDPSVKDQIEEIHPQIDFYYNSFNICLGKQGSGKTALCLKELIKLSKIPNHLYNLILYVANSNDDVTFQLLKQNVNIPIIYVSYEEINDKFEKFIKEREDTIHHTFILFEDASCVFQGDRNPWNKWICCLRHLRCTVWANIHVWKSINTFLKTQASCCYVFSGYSRESMSYVYRQNSIEKEFNNFMAIYSIIKQNQVLMIDNIKGNLKII